MRDIERIRELLKQNQKIIRFASASVELGSFEDAVIAAYEEDKNTVHELRVSEKEFMSSFSDYKKETDEAIIEITKDGIRMYVKTADVVGELNAELKLGSVIEATSKWFLVDTSNFKLTKTSLTFTGEVNSDNCKVGGWSISGNSMSGSSLSSGTVNCSYLRLGNAVADLIDCNPDNVSGKTVTLSGLKKLDDEEKSESSTTIEGIVSKGPIYADNGWDDSTHGCPWSVRYHYLECEFMNLRTKSDTYTSKNRLTCDEIYSSKAGSSWSDRRLKKNIETLDGEKAESVMLAIEPSEFDIKKTGSHAAGYIAQDVKKALKKAGLRGVVSKSNGYYGIRYEELIAFRIAVIKRNEEKIEKLRRIRHGN